MHSSTFAAEGWFGGIALFIVGLVVVGLLIGAVVWRGRDKGRGSRASRTGEPSSGPGTPSDPEPKEALAADDFGAEGERLSPHQMKGYGNQGNPAPSDKKDGA